MLAKHGACFLVLQMALDRESVVKATPFYKAVTRQDSDQADETAAGGGRRPSVAKSRADDARSILSAGSRVVGAAKRVAVADAGPKAILAKASLTSVVFELVRSDPWETVMRAGVSGLSASFSSNEGGGGGMAASVTLADVLLTDVRPKAKDNAYTMILAPLRPRATPEENSSPARGEGEAGGGGDTGDGSTGPLISVKAKMDGDNGGMDVDVNLASFACNLMVEPIKVGTAFVELLPSGYHHLGSVADVPVTLEHNAVMFPLLPAPSTWYLDARIACSSCMSHTPFAAARSL